MKSGFCLFAIAGILATMETLVAQGPSSPEIVRLPPPHREGAVGVESALAQRRSVREFRRDPLTLEQVAQLLWAAQGVSRPDGLRTAPSAGALYPLEIRVVAGQVAGLPEGVYAYSPKPHDLVRVVAGDLRAKLAAAALGQDWMADAPAIFAISAVYERTTRKYGARGQRYVHMDVGHAAENLCLQAVALGLGTTVVGAFDDDAVKTLLQMPGAEQPQALLPVGRPK